MSEYKNWTNLPRSRPASVARKDWRVNELPPLSGHSMLPYGKGRSYGDVCLNNDQVLLDTSCLNRFIRFDKEAGLLKVESGLSVGQILEVIVPSGWFLPVVPGTQHVTMGGAIANDINSKNHHIRGSFGNNITAFELLLSSGQRLICSADQNKELFHATIGGLGLTGLVVWVEIQLIPIESNIIEFEEFGFYDIDEYIELSNSSQDWEYTVAWIDCIRHKHGSYRGIFARGRHSEHPSKPSPRHRLKMPLTPPISLVNQISLRVFNKVYFELHSSNHGIQYTHYKNFFFPLDSVQHWNRMYGPKGFYQYQFVTPDIETIKSALKLISVKGQGSFLSVLKVFGDTPANGMLSFARPGFTLALDFPNRGRKTLDLLESLDRMVIESGGAIYPAKDARMGRNAFECGYPNAGKFEQYIDRQFSSSLWRRLGQ